MKFTIKKHEVKTLDDVIRYEVEHTVSELETSFGWRYDEQSLSEMYKKIDDKVRNRRISYYFSDLLINL
jgi:hypothetical protein